MQEAFTPDRAETEYRRTRERPAPRPDRFALWAVVMAVIAMIAGVATSDAGASGGGIGTGGDGGGDANRAGSKYAGIWEDYNQRNKRWARKTSECESGGDPNAIGGGGKYRGAFQFLRSTWRNSPKSPGGDPIRYRWKTQAVVAVELKKRDGTGHWPVCG
jgi:hypothetical protein